MPIRKTDGPPGGREILARAIAPLVAGGTEVARGMASPTAEGDALQIDLAAPHEIFVAGLRELADGRLLEVARPQGWRYLVANGDRVVGSATLRRDPDAGEWSFSHLTRGRYVDATVRALAAAERSGDVERGEYDLRLLDVPAVQLRMLWLYAEGPDLLVPLAPAPRPLRANRVYTEGDLLRTVRDAAAEWMVRADDGLE